MSERTRQESRLEFRNGRPVICINGTPLSYAMYSDPCVNLFPPEKWLEHHKEFRDSGVHLYTLQPVGGVDGIWNQTRFWTGDGVYPDCSPHDGIFCVDRQAESLLEMDPEALFFVRLGECVPNQWFAANPEHTQHNSAGTTANKSPSMASSKALADYCRYLARVVEYCEAQSWANRVVGYLYYPFGEGISLLNCEGFAFDQSSSMQTAFGQWVREKYGTEDALRKAWGDPKVSMEEVVVPGDAEWAEMRSRTFHWPERHQMQKVWDYMLLQRELFIQWQREINRTIRSCFINGSKLLALDIGKQPMQGWQIRLFFSGQGPSMEFPDILGTSGSLDIGELLDDTSFDMLVTPADYTARAAGFGWESEGIADSLLLRGKTIWVENDCRTFMPGEDDTLGACRNVEEVRAVLLRNSAWSLTRGHMDYWMIVGSEYFHEPSVQREGIRKVTPLIDRAPSWPHRETEHAIAMILDDSSPLYENGTSGFQNLAVLWQRVSGLAHCGIPYRIYLLSDLERENMPDYRCYLFPNLFMLNQERMSLLKRKVFRDGRISIFGPATGITDGCSLSAEWAGKLLGVEMELIPKQCARRVIINGRNEITQSLPASMVYGDSYAYGPILAPAKGAVEKGGALELGMAVTFWGMNRPGLFVKDFAGSYKVAWSAAAPLPANLLRELARYGGCHVWCEEDDVVMASETLASIHSVKPGVRRLKLPSPRTVWDLLTGEWVGKNLGEFEVHMGSPETKLFYFGEDSPFMGRKTEE